MICAHRAERGYSLLELSVALAVLGLMAVGFVSYWAASERAEIENDQQALMIRAEQSLVGFLYANSRLPCPDTDDDGRENCSGGYQKGFLPWRTLGLPVLGAETLRYGVYRDSTNGLNLALKAQRFEPLLIEGGSASTSANLVDTCYALDVIAEQRVNASDTSMLHVGDATTERNVAYALAAPGATDMDGNGDVFDDRQSQSSPIFDRPTRQGSATYDDRVVAAGFEALGSFLSCGESLAAIGHTHFNAANASHMMSITLEDYTTLLRLQKDLADASLMSAGAGVASATGGALASAGEVALSTAQAIGSYGALSPIIIPAVAAVVTNSVSIATAAIGFADATAGVVEAGERVDRSVALQAQALAVAQDIGDNAKEADSRGF